MVRSVSGNTTILVAVDSGYAAELMEPTADTSMGQATEKKKRDHGNERTSNDKKKRAKAVKKAMMGEHREN